MNENDFARSILEILSPHFHIQEQIRGRHFSGKQMIIDAIVQPKNNWEWKNPEVALGIEFKDDLRIRGDTTNYTRWLAQCVDYSHTEWNNFGYIYVFACPSLIEGIPGMKNVGEMAWLLPRIMGHLGIGELKHDPRRGLTFYLQELHRVWTQQSGVECGRQYNLKRVFGGR